MRLLSSNLGGMKASRSVDIIDDEAEVRRMR